MVLFVTEAPFSNTCVYVCVSARDFADVKIRIRKMFKRCSPCRDFVSFFKQREAIPVGTGG